MLISSKLSLGEKSISLHSSSQIRASWLVIVKTDSPFSNDLSKKLTCYVSRRPTLIYWASDDSFSFEALTAFLTSHETSLLDRQLTNFSLFIDPRRRFCQCFLKLSQLSIMLYRLVMYLRPSVTRVSYTWGDQRKSSSASVFISRRSLFICCLLKDTTRRQNKKTSKNKEFSDERWTETSEPSKSCTLWLQLYNYSPRWRKISFTDGMSRWREQKLHSLKWGKESAVDSRQDERRNYRSVLPIRRHKEEYQWLSVFLSHLRYILERD